MNLLGQTQSGPLSHFLIMALGRHGGRTPQYPAPAYNEHILDGVAFLAPVVKALLFAPMLQAGQTPFGAVDNQFFQLRLFSQQLVKISRLPSRSMQRNQLPGHHCQLAHPLAGRIGFEIQQDEKQLLLGADQAAFASPTRAPPPARTSARSLLEQR